MANSVSYKGPLYAPPGSIVDDGNPSNVWSGTGWSSPWVGPTGHGIGPMTGAQFDPVNKWMLPDYLMNNGWNPAIPGGTPGAVPPAAMAVNGKPGGSSFSMNKEDIVRLVNGVVQDLVAGIDAFWPIPDPPATAYPQNVVATVGMVNAQGQAIAPGTLLAAAGDPLPVEKQVQNLQTWLAGMFARQHRVNQAQSLSQIGTDVIGTILDKRLPQR